MLTEVVYVANERRNTLYGSCTSASTSLPQKFYLLHINFKDALYLQERSQFYWECGGGGTQSLRSHAMCPPYCNECISLLKLWLVSVSRRRGILQRRRGESGGEKLCVKSHLSCQRADTGHPGTRGLWCSESGHWPSFPPTPLHPLLPLHHPSYNIPPTKHSSAAPSHLFFTVILPSMNCPPPTPPSLCPLLLSFLLLLFPCNVNLIL